MTPSSFIGHLMLMLILVVVLVVVVVMIVVMIVTVFAFPWLFIQFRDPRLRWWFGGGGVGNSVSVGVRVCVGIGVGSARPGLFVTGLAHSKHTMIMTMIITMIMTMTIITCWGRAELDVEVLQHSAVVVIRHHLLQMMRIYYSNITWFGEKVDIVEAHINSITPA